MHLQGEGKLLRIFIGESDHLKHEPLYSVIVNLARKEGLAGVTVLRGLMGYGANTRIHRANLLDLSSDLPIVVEIVDTEEKLTTFFPKLNQVLEETNCGGMVTLERADIIRYFHEKKSW